MFLDGSKFCEPFLKRVTQGTYLWNYFKIRPTVPEEEIFKALLKKLDFVAMATRVFDWTKFCEHFLKSTSYRTFLPSLVQIGPDVWEKMFTDIVDHARRSTSDGHITTLKAPLEHVVLRWAKNAGNQHFLFFPQCFQRIFYPGLLKVGIV